MMVVASFAGPAESAPLTVAFDFSRAELGIDAAVNGTPVHVILDTGVDPSVIDIARADALGLKVDRRRGGEASGFGDGEGAAVFPLTMTGVTIGNRSFPPFASLASDMSGLSRRYGRKLDGVLGDSFLSDKIVLIDYPGRTLSILDWADDATPMVRSCRTRWTTLLAMADGFPVIPGFRFGAAAAGPITLDTGSNGGIGLFRNALDLPGVRKALVQTGTITHSGARGDAKSTTYALAAAVGFGPFSLPAGQVVTLHREPGSTGTIVANVGNTLFAAMKIRVLLDYRGRTLGFYGDCL